MSEPSKDYDSLVEHPLKCTDEAERLVEEILRGYEPELNGDGTPRGFDLVKDERTEYGFYWEFEDITEAAQEIVAILERCGLIKPWQERRDV